MAKNIVPIVFCFDENFILPARVCITSLLVNADESTFYDIFILHADNCNLEKAGFESLHSFGNCNIQFRKVGNQFNGSFVIRGITIASYYRLLIPQLIPEYDKIIYADVDMIFRMDLSEMYDTDISSVHVAGVPDYGILLCEKDVEYVENILHLSNVNKYIQGGLLLLNSKKMREDNLLQDFIRLSRKQFTYQDQDLLNLVCEKTKILLPMKYNVTLSIFYHSFYDCNKLLNLQSEYASLNDILSIGNIHYNGPKPWIKYCPNFDIWWEYYRKSPNFDHKFYFDFFYNRLNESDSWSLWKRIKVLFHFFLK